MVLSMTPSQTPSQFASETVIGKDWPGITGIKHVMIFGDSYSAIGYGRESPHPTRDNPLGVPFPGYIDQFEDPTQCNWVGYFSKSNPEILIYNHAQGGARVVNVGVQVGWGFLPGEGCRPEWAPWVAEDTLFVTWVGINDSAFVSEHTENMTELFKIQEVLYETGARNFLFINVPPINRSPVGKFAKAQSYVNFNTHLHKAAQTFVSAHPDISMFVFSAWDTFNNILDHPSAFDFPERDVALRAGSIWVDHLHPTHRVHEIIARDIGDFLAAQPAYGST